MALTQPEINELKRDYRTVLDAAQAAGAGLATNIAAAPPNGFTVTFSAQKDGADVTPPLTFTSQNLTFDEAVVAWRDLRRAGLV